MIKLDELEMDEAIDRAIEKFCDNYAPLYGRPYYARSTLRSLCIQLIAELCVAESEKVKGEYGDDFVDVVCDPSIVKCPRCGHVEIEWDREHDWYCPDCGNYVEYKDREG